ncbi:unnamed protein product [Tuber aestivum]|uniref:Uncharacterized protein n=1 Tax=Tuber aestivum TaxID=59557 RepID=A0A292PNB8_9PEZI|nr:unnamed protein product [Tuber aestivum]
MNNWEWDEIYAAFTLDRTDPTPAEIQTLYTTFICLGPIARTCLLSVPAELGTTQYDQKFSAYVQTIDIEIQ